MFIVCEGKKLIERYSMREIRQFLSGQCCQMAKFDPFKPKGPNTYNLKIGLLPTGYSSQVRAPGAAAGTRARATPRALTWCDWFINVTTSNTVAHTIMPKEAVLLAHRSMDRLTA